MDGGSSARSLALERPTVGIRSDTDEAEGTRSERVVRNSFSLDELHVDFVKNITKECTVEAVWIRYKRL